MYNFFCIKSDSLKFLHVHTNKQFNKFSEKEADILSRFKYQNYLIYAKSKTILKYSETCVKQSTYLKADTLYKWTPA